MTHTPKSLLLYGGTFDPIHNGHLIVARTVAEKLAIGKTILIVSANPPHKLNEPVTNAIHRMAMTHLAVENDPLFDVSDCELHRDGPSYTLETVRYFQNKYGPETKLYWLIGADSIADLPGWYEIKDLCDECQIVTAARPGYDTTQLGGLEKILTPERLLAFKDHILETPLLEIAATDIRRRVNARLPISHLTPLPVINYITKHELYTE
ncbi:MAG: nicotinate-nucleotide adenylyltransferase [Phycisphaerae bacterium]|nr:nicotinate-nucleotide adenylyltransferase [Phycisphaerae bacterium]